MRFVFPALLGLATLLSLAAFLESVRTRHDTGVDSTAAVCLMVGLGSLAVCYMIEGVGHIIAARIAEHPKICAEHLVVMQSRLRAAASSSGHEGRRDAPVARAAS